MAVNARGVSAEEPRLSLTPEPFRYSYVTGDGEKVSAPHWMKDRYAGGIKDFSLDYNDDAQGIESAAEGHAIIDENDIDGVLTIKQQDKGFIKVDYSRFRKDYAGTGGVYHPFQNLKSINLERKLQLNIARFEVEAGLTLPEWPELTFVYEREEKDGAKSRLTWATVLEGGVSRKISPSWQEIDETVNVFEIKAHKEIEGFDLHGDQRWELVRADSTRYEQQFSDTTVLANNKIRRQDQEPSTDAMTTTVGMEKWFWKEKAFVSSGYRYGHLDSKEIENIYESDAAGVIKNFSNPEQVRNALGYSKYDAHTWVSSFMVNPWKWLNSIARLKAEVFREKGSSQYPKDSTPVSATVGSVPDGIINTIDDSGTSNKVVRVGEGVSLRYTGIPRTALYTDLELEQVQDLLTEDRFSRGIQSAQNLGETWSRVTATASRRGVGKIGGRVSPWNFMDLTSEVGHRQNNVDYDDRREDEGAGGARSSFVDWQNISTNEFSTRMTLRPVRWFQPSMRYQMRADRYISGFEGQETESQSNMLSNIYTFDATVLPVPDLLITGSFSKQDAWVTTIARYNVAAQTPTFNSGVYSWLLSAVYTINPRATLTNSVLYSRADNFNDFTAAGLPLGAEFYNINYTGGLELKPRPDLTIAPKYAFYQYTPNAKVESEGYTANVFWLDVTLQWPFIMEIGNKLQPAAK